MEHHDEPRAAAIDRIANKRELRNHALVYCAVNILLVVIWAASGAGYFWPIWVIAGWGIGLAAHAWRIYGQKPISEADIIEEMHGVREFARPHVFLNPRSSMPYVPLPLSTHPGPHGLFKLIDPARSEDGVYWNVVLPPVNTPPVVNGWARSATVPVIEIPPPSYLAE